MKARFLIGTLAVMAMTACANAWVITDEFNGTTLDPMWTVGDKAGSYNAGGGAGLAGSGYYLIHNTMVEGASNIRASLGNVGASDTARVDAVLRTDQYGNGRWSNQAVIYFDNENWIGMRLGYSGGEAGFYRQGVVNGDIYSNDGAGPAWNLNWYFTIISIELTPTEIRFYTSAANTDHINTTDIDSNVTMVPSLTMPRPASFTGDAYAILGKGFAYSNSGHDPFLVNNGSTFVTDSDNYIAFARLSVVPEPSCLGLLVLGCGAALTRRRIRGEAN